MLFALGSCVCPGAALMSGHNCMAYEKRNVLSQLWRPAGHIKGSVGWVPLEPCPHCWRLLAFLGCGRGTPALASTVLW